MSAYKSMAIAVMLVFGVAACGGADGGENLGDAERAATDVSDTAASTVETASDNASSMPEYVVPEPGPVYVDGYLDLAWEELLPPGEEEKLAQLYQQQMALLYSSPIAEGSAADKAMQIGTFNIVPELDGTKIRLPGFTVPFEYGSDANITEFLLVPYFGACLHAPPPPPNQTVFVSTDEAIKLKDLAQAVWIYGELKTARENTELADAAYTIVMERIEDYEY